MLLLFAQFAFGMTLRTDIGTLQCPLNCKCGYAATSLTVTCQGRADVDHEELPDQLNSLLFSNLTYGSLTSLSIINTPLTHIPSFICRLTTLTHLQLDNNRLTQLPDCFTNLSNLLRFSAHDNAIERLQDGVFQGLTKLQYLNLNRNSISSIGVKVFALSSNLDNLVKIHLSENDLVSLEPWFIFRGLIGSFQKIVLIDLSHNKISNFTNAMGLHDVCSNELPFSHTDLRYNDIRHFLDMFEGWNVSFKDVVNCYNITEGRINFLVDVTENGIPCDCIDYNVFKVRYLKQIEYYWEAMLCILTDPLTGKSSRVDGFQIPLELFVCELTERCPAGCICVHRPANATLHIYCSNTNLTVLPLQLPELPDNHTKYKLDFSNNGLRRLEHRDYFANTFVLDVSNCDLDSVSNWEEIAKISVVSLYGNKLTSLPPSLMSVNTTGKLNIASNPWDCSCDNKWMSGWLANIAKRELLTRNVLCHSPDRLRGKNIIQVSNEEFCVDPATKAVKRALTISISSFTGLVVVVLSVGLIVYRLRVKLYTKWKFHPFDRDECLGEDMDYDVFVSCSTDDNIPHGNRIRELLEERGYRVCYPPRDFVAGDSIYDNIYNAVVCSKRTVCLLTSHFVERFKLLILHCLIKRCFMD